MRDAGVSVDLFPAGRRGEHRAVPTYWRREIGDLRLMASWWRDGPGDWYDVDLRWRPAPGR